MRVVISVLEILTQVADQTSVEDDAVRKRTTGENRRLLLVVEALKVRLDKSKARCAELSEQHRQQSVLQERMRERLQQMDLHSQQCSQQVLDLLAKESILMRDRRELANHIDFLHRELLTVPDDVGIGNDDEKGDGANKQRDKGRNRRRDKMAALVQNSSMVVEDVLKDVRGNRITPDRQGWEKGGDTGDNIPERLNDD